MELVWSKKFSFPPCSDQNDSMEWKTSLMICKTYGFALKLTFGQDSF